MASTYNTLKNLNLNKLNKTLKNKPHVLVGPRATKGSYGDVANILQESINKAEREEKKRRKITEKYKRRMGMGRRGIGVAVKGGGRIL
jgi:hypothetical protein